MRRFWDSALCTKSRLAQFVIVTYIMFTWATNVTFGIFSRSKTAIYCT